MVAAPRNESAFGRTCDSGTNAVRLPSSPVDAASTVASGCASLPPSPPIAYTKRAASVGRPATAASAVGAFVATYTDEGAMLVTTGGGAFTSVTVKALFRIPNVPSGFATMRSYEPGVSPDGTTADSDVALRNVTARSADAVTPSP